MSPSPAGSRPSNTLHGCSVICAEPALENIGCSGSPAICLDDATMEIHEQIIAILQWLTLSTCLLGRTSSSILMPAFSARFDTKTHFQIRHSLRRVISYLRCRD